MTIGESLKAARKNAGLTQKELGERVGLSYQSIAQWENDLRKPKPETLQKLAKALNVSIWSLAASDSKMDFLYGYLSGIEDERFERAVFNYTYSVVEQRLIDFFAELNEDGQQKAIERVAELAEIPKYQKPPSADPEALKETPQD